MLSLGRPIMNAHVPLVFLYGLESVSIDWHVSSYLGPEGGGLCACAPWPRSEGGVVP